MPEETAESVRVSRVILETYRQWATASGRTLTGMITQVLIDAAQHYSDGVQAGLAQAREIVEAERAMVKAERAR